MFENFPYTNFHDLNLDWIIQKVKEAYSPDNPPEAVVLSVNGETGDVILYRDAVVTLPDVQESQWNIHRLANGQSSGIQFIQGDKAQRIDGTHRYDMYDAGNPPPYPVRSVNGMTGAVTVVKSVNGDNGDVWLYPEAIIEFPDTSENFFQMKRTAAGTDIGIEFDKNGPAKRLNDTDEYEIYDEGNPPPYPVTSVGTLTGAVAILDTSIVTDQGTQKLKIAFPVTSVDGQTGTVETWGYTDEDEVTLPIESEAAVWTLNRGTPSGNLGIKFMVNGLTDNPEGYLVLDDGTNPPTTLKILTPADIPSSSGVVSVNGANGVVILYGTDIAMSSTDSTSLKAAIEAVDGKTGADIPVSGTDATKIDAAIAAVNAKTGADIDVSGSDSTKIDSALAALDAKTGADIPVSGSDSTKIDAALSSLTTAVNSNAASINGIEDAIAIVANNNTHGAISSGQFVYVKNHGTLAEGLYKASTNIAANAALSSSNLVADSSGGLNALKSDITTLNSKITEKTPCIRNATTLQEIVDAIPESYDVVIANGTTAISSLLGFSVGVVEGIFTRVKSSTVNRVDFIASQQNGNVSIGNINVANSNAVTYHLTSVGNTVERVDSFTIAASGSKSFTLPSDGVYMLAGYGNVAALNSVVFLIGGYTSASRCTVTNLTGLTAVTITATNTSTLSFTATNSNSSSGITLQIIKLV